MKKIITSTLLISLISAGVMLNNRGLEVRDLLNDNYTNEVTGKVAPKKAAEVANNNLSDVKAQISALNAEKNSYQKTLGELEQQQQDINEKFNLLTFVSEISSNLFKFI